MVHRPENRYVCGIAGIVSAAPMHESRLRQVELMRGALAHRGPDAAHSWTSPNRLAAFANTRLAIIAPAAIQPMSIDNGRLTLTFNGEIYNFLELRRELQARGANFQTRSDTEVILHAYDAFGDGCVARLRGMFAFAIWDQRQHKCLLARDPFGIKPLYYYQQGGDLMFASEVKALLRSGAVPREVDAQSMYQYFRAGSVQDPRTLVRNVRSLDAGHALSWTDGEVHRNKYWELSFGTDADAATPPAEVTHDALRDSIAHHFVSDVPVGMLLSGGVDSTCLLALAAEAGTQDLHTFTLSVNGSPDDEGERARRTAGHFRARHEECRVDAAATRALFDGYLAAMDQPGIDGLNTYTIARFAADRGMKVMLSGVGGDEIFGGYPSFSAVPRMTAWRRRFVAPAPLRTAVAAALSAASDPRLRRVADLITEPPSLAASYATYRAIFTRTEASALCERYSGSTVVEPDELSCDVDDPTPEDAVSRLELSRYLRNQLLRDADVMGMACGVEVRTPFLDSVVVGAVSRIPARQRMAAAKRLLVESVPNLPDGIAHRPKRCFQFPFERWMADGEWRQTFAAVEHAGPVTTGTWYRKWCVLTMEHWLTRLSEGERAWM